MHATGSTNPFRQSAFVNQATGQGWQANPANQGTLGGMSVQNVETVGVFPRPGQPQGQQQMGQMGQQQTGMGMGQMGQQQTGMGQGWS